MHHPRTVHATNRTAPNPEEMHADASFFCHPPKSRLVSRSLSATFREENDALSANQLGSSSFRRIVVIVMGPRQRVTGEMSSPHPFHHA